MGVFDQRWSRSERFCITSGRRDSGLVSYVFGICLNGGGGGEGRAGVGGRRSSGRGLGGVICWWLVPIAGTSDFDDIVRDLYIELLEFKWGREKKETERNCFSAAMPVFVK